MNPYASPTTAPFRPRSIGEILRGNRLDFGSVIVGMTWGAGIGWLIAYMGYRAILEQAGVTLP